MSITLMPKDQCFLENLGLATEVIETPPHAWVIFSDWEAPDGFQPRKVRIALQLPQTYPDGPMDMFWVDPPIARIDGKAINALSIEQFANASWQRWSRHRTSVNPWRTGIDGVETQLAFVDLELHKELLK